MKRFALITGAVFTVGLLFGQGEHTLKIIPEPVSVSRQNGYFKLPSSIIIAATDSSLFTAELLKEKFSTATNYRVAVSHKSKEASIRFIFNKQTDSILGDEGYRLIVSAKGIIIFANRAAGLFYGMQTLLQLLPEQIESKSKVAGTDWKIPFTEITDYPRFGWRGLMFDVARHFFSKGQVKAFIDDMVLYKYNILHLHLSDDQGWRIEIKELPKLTAVGAWNVEKTGGNFGNFSPPGDNEPRNHGGYFTQEDIIELVTYAKTRFVNILPEIDVPGHSMAAVASYPELSGTPGNYTVNSGENFMDFNNSASAELVDNALLIDNTLSPANEKVYVFLDKVFSELSRLFPFEYIHIGGDECVKNFWKKNEEIRELMNKEGLKNMDEVQSYFIKRVEKIVSAKGKKIIGWDEILQGGLPPSAAVMSWRGLEGGIEASKLGHEVVMTPFTNVYLDLMQGDSCIESPVYSTVRLKEAYSFDPVPEAVNPVFIKGGQANLWTEKVYTMRHLQYMVWPRAFAVAEVLWSPEKQKNWIDFTNRVEQHFKRFDAAGRKYAVSMFEPWFNTEQNDKGELSVQMLTEIEGLDIHYSFDNSFPDEFYPAYTGAVTIPKDCSLLRVVSYKNGKQKGRIMTVTVDELKKRAVSRQKTGS